MPISNYHNGITSFIYTSDDYLFIEMSDKNARYWDRFKIILLQGNEYHQIIRIGQGLSIPDRGRFKKMRPLATLLDPHMVSFPLNPVSGDYLKGILTLVVGWINDNVLGLWALHLGESDLTIFFSDEEDAVMFRLSLTISPSSARA